VNPIDSHEPVAPPSLEGTANRFSVSQDDPRVIEALREYAAALEAGQKPNRQTFLAGHADIAGPLAECLDGLEFVHAAGPPLQRSAVDRPTAGLSTPAELEPATPLGDFQILREIGRGGMGVVYEAVQLSLGRRVALKVLPFAAALDAKQLQRFKNEAQAAAHLQHPHIVPVYYVGCERGVHFYAMQLIDGHTLASVISELRRQVQPHRPEAPRVVSAGSTRSAERASGRWAPAKASPSADAYTGPDPAAPAEPSPTTTAPVAALSTERSATSPAFFRTVAHLGIQAAEALEHAHQLGIIHRDIKPANLLVEGRAGGVNPLMLWVTDFGLARLGTDAGLTMTGDLVGTLRYMSPEQALAKGPVVDLRTDLYSLGATLYELLTLEPAHNGGDRHSVLRQIADDEPIPPRTLNRAVPVELETIVLKALSKAADERYASAQELADDLQRYLEDRPIHARRPTLRQRATKWARRHKTVVRAALVVLLLTVVGLAVSTAFIWRAKEDLNRANADLTQAFERERQNAYYQRIALAERESAVNNLGRMQQLLDQCPEDLRGWEWHYLKGLGRQRLAPLRHDEEVLGVTYSPTGQWFASGTLKGGVTVWDARTREPLSTFAGGDGYVLVLAFSPDGRRLACNRGDGVVKVWDALTGRELLAWPAHRGKIVSVAFSPDGRRLFSAGSTQSAGVAEDLEVKVWDAANGCLLQTLPSLTRGRLRIAFSPDGRYVAGSANDDGSHAVKVWDTQTGQELLTLNGHTGRVQAMAFSPDGHFLASAIGSWGMRAGGEVKVWELPAGRERHTLHGHIGYVQCLAFSPDGRRLASAGMDRTVKVWDVATGSEAVTLRGHTDYVWAVAFSPDGRKLLSGSYDHTVRVWDGTPLEEANEGPQTLHSHRRGVLAVAFHPSGQRLATAGPDGVKIWDLASGQEGPTFRARGEGLASVAFSPDGARLAFGGIGGEVRIGDAATGEEIMSLFGPPNLVTQVAFSPDGRYLATGGTNQPAQLWSSATGQVVQTISANEESLLGLAFSPDGRRVALASFDHGVRIWDVTTRRVIVTLRPPHPGRATAVAFRPDGKVLASASADGTIQFWDTETWQRQKILHDATGGVETLAFSPDGRLLAWGGTDATVKIADAATGEILETLRGHTSWVEGLAFSSDGASLASASLDGTVKIWLVPRGPKPLPPVPPKPTP
jgi:WD40 repeat protein/serine/threonine protein kinase